MKFEGVYKLGSNPDAYFEQHPEEQEQEEPDEHSEHFPHSQAIVNIVFKFVFWWKKGVLSDNQSIGNVNLNQRKEDKDQEKKIVGRKKRIQLIFIFFHRFCFYTYKWEISYEYKEIPVKSFSMGYHKVACKSQLNDNQSQW